MFFWVKALIQLEQYTRWQESVMEKPIRHRILNSSISFVLVPGVLIIC